VIVKIPKEIKIGAFPYKVGFVPNLLVTESRMGECNHVQLKIGIDPIIPDITKASTLIHEVLHLIDRNSKCDLGEDNMERIANGMTEFLYNNLDIEFGWSEFEL